MEMNMLKEKWRRKNDPSPCSYNKDEALDKSSKFNKGGVYWKLNKAPKESFADKVIKKGKTSPGVGKYNYHLVLDKVARPMRKY